MLFVPPSIPFMVPEAEALTEAGCLSLADLDGMWEYYYVLVCENPFDVTVYPGQRLMVLDPNGGGEGRLPWKSIPGHGETGATGTYQYESGSFSGTVRIVDSPSIGVSIQNVTATFSGSQMTVSGVIANGNSYDVKDLYVMWSVTDDAGNEKGTWTRYGSYDGQAYSGTFPAGGTGTFSETLCCGDSGMTTATPYIVQAFQLDGTPLVNVPVYADGWSGDTTPPTMTFQGFDDGMVHTRMATNSTGFNFYFHATTTEYQESNPLYCQAGSETITPLGNYPAYPWRQYNHLFPVGTTTVTCAATDAAGNTGTASFTVVVTLEGASDTTPPVITFSQQGSNPANPSTTRGYAGSEHTRIATNSTGYNFLWHTYVTESNGANPSACHTTESSFTADTYYVATWVDDLYVSVYNHLFPIGTTTVTCAATDYAGNTGTGTFTVIVTPPTDATPPTIIFGLSSGPSWNNPSFVDGFEHTRTASNSTGFNFLWYTTATDAVWQIASNTSYCQAGSETITGTQAHFPNSDTGQNVMYNHLFPVGTTTVTCSVSNYLGTVGTASFTVTVTGSGTDTTPPTIGFYGFDDGMVHTRMATNSTGYNLFWVTTATSNVYGVYHQPSCQGTGFPSMNSIFESDARTHYNHLFPVGTTTVTCSATDGEGNTGSATFTITVTFTDTTPSTISFQGFDDEMVHTRMALNSTGYSYYWHATAGESVALGHVPNQESNPLYCQDGSETMTSLGQFYNWRHYVHLFPVGTTTVTCTTTDAAGNTGTASFTMIVTEPAAGTESEPVVEEEILIPDWIKNNAGWWADGLIDDRAFVTGLQWLISNGIMNIPPTEQGAGSDDVIPSWIKNNADWWADDLIDDRAFVTGLQWLITNGIMIIG